MATSIRIKIGLSEYQFEVDSSIRLGAGAVLGPREAKAVLETLRRSPQLDRLRPLADSVARRSLEWDEELPEVLAELVALGRVRIRLIEASSYRVLGRTREEAEAEPEQVVNEIVETHTVTIELLDTDGNPVPGEPYRIKLPDGSVVSGSLDDEGRARVTGIEQAGTCQVCFPRRDASIWAPA